MIYGTKKTVRSIGNTTTSHILKMNGKYGHKAYINFRMQIKVADKNAELGEYIKFTEEIDQLKQNRQLVVDPDDNLTWPMFVVKYPHDYAHGSYFIIKCYTVLLDEP